MINCIRESVIWIVAKIGSTMGCRLTLKVFVCSEFFEAVFLVVSTFFTKVKFSKFLITPPCDCFLSVKFLFE